MADAEVLDLKDVVLANTSFGPQEIANIRSAIASDFVHFGELRDAVGQMEQETDRSPATQTKLGVCQLLLGKFHKSRETLNSSDGGALAGACGGLRGDHRVLRQFCR